jgi:hypothetical protein
MARRSRRKKARVIDAITGVALAVAGLVCLVAFGAGYWWVKSTKTALDDANCPLNSGPRAVHVVMVDQTDPISQLQAQRIQQIIQQYREVAAFGMRFDIYVVEGDTKTTLLPILSICSPNRAEDANIYIENPELIKRRYEERFVAVLDKTVTELLRATTRDSSPIIESMKAAAISSFGPWERRKIPFRLTIVSDMVQHTQLNSHFKSEPNLRQLVQSTAWRSLQPNLHNAEVNVLYLLRPEARRQGIPIQNRGHQEFWAQLIAASNGRLVDNRENAFEPI